MADLKFDIDIKQLTKDLKETKKQVQEEIIGGVRALAIMTNAKLREVARDELGSLNKKYQENIEFINPEENLWIVNLKEPAMFIESGRKSGFMSELLAGKSAKTSKDGTRYAVIPFEHSKNPSEQSPKAREITKEIKDFLKQKDVNYRKIEYGADGSPRLGLLHKFDIDSARPSPKAKDPALKGLAIYQTQDEKGQVRRDVMTFRVISEKHRQDGRWIHPGFEGKDLMGKVFDWALQEWEISILPSIMKDK